MILTRDEERNLPRVLASLPPDMPVLVLDHESEDRTREIAQAHGARVIVRPFDGFVKARRYALAQIQTPWALMIDADEALDERLREAVLGAEEGHDGYYVSRVTYYRGRPMRMWSGERLLRLFKADRVRLESSPAAGGASQLHEHWECGDAGLLPGTLLHYSYPTHAAYRAKYEYYTSLEASGVRASVKAWLAEALRAPLRFAWYALVRRALLDGPDGVRVAWCSAWYPAVVRRKALRGAKDGGK